MLVDTDNINVTLRKTDGKPVTVPKERLIADDRVYVDKAFSDLSDYKTKLAEWTKQSAELEELRRAAEQLIASANTPEPQPPSRSTIAAEVAANNEKKRQQQTIVGSSSPTKKWYEGGTLHGKTALDWQVASREDKIATCADFVTKMWKDGNLKPKIANSVSTVDGVRPYARELVDFLDAAFKPDTDPDQNRILFSNQTVSGTAAIGMVTMGWTK